MRARVAIGQVAAEPPSSVMKSRRRIARSQAQDHVTDYSRDRRLAEQGSGAILRSSNSSPPMSAMGQKRRRRRYHARRVGRALDLDDFVDIAFAGDDVVGHVEICGAGAAVDRVPAAHSIALIGRG